MTYISYIKTNSDNFTPCSRTPWAGTAIANIKKTNLGHSFPEKIGESWEISSDAKFTSKISYENNIDTNLNDFLSLYGKTFLGEAVFKKFGPHLPILLKWIEANDNLSVQIHPFKTHDALQPLETGKPEAWLVINTTPNSKIFLGFNEKTNRQKIHEPDFINNIESYLHTFIPQTLDYISIPPGLVHALGPETLVIEPQLIWPGKIGKTWRIYDWQRIYDAQGNLSKYGIKRELHTEQALSVVDWSLPKGKELEKLLRQNLSTHKPFLGNSHHNPFAALVLNKEGKHHIDQLKHDVFTLVSCWSGIATFFDSNSGQKLVLKGGESAIISAETKRSTLILEKSSANTKPGIALFSLNIEAIPWLF